MTVATRTFTSLIFVLFLPACTVVYNQPPPNTDTNHVTASPTKPEPTPPDTKESWRPSNISEAVSACKNIQSAKNIPIACKFDYLDGTPVMVVGFPDIDIIQGYLEPMDEYVTGPFCDAANKASRQAFLLIVVTSAKVGKLYSCESGEASNWFSLDDHYEF